MVTRAAALVTPILAPNQDATFTSAYRILDVLPSSYFRIIIANSWRVSVTFAKPLKITAPKSRPCVFFIISLVRLLPTFYSYKTVTSYARYATGPSQTGWTKYVSTVWFRAPISNGYKQTSDRNRTPGKTWRTPANISVLLWRARQYVQRVPGKHNESRAPHHAIWWRCWPGAQHALPRGTNKNIVCSDGILPYDVIISQWASNKRSNQFYSVCLEEGLLLKCFCGLLDNKRGNGHGHWPSPKMDECIDSLRKAIILSTLPDNSNQWDI